ncbi:hypothetical protein [Pseudomonas sp. MPB26]|uniref:hypothetical protein n=1 Tax=Pseudomonas sp. MPB26 TaxID=3388491 RepID=UPI003984B7AE
MNTKKPYTAPTGTFTANIDGVPNFNDDIRQLTAGRSLEIAGTQDNANSLVRTIAIALDPDIPDGIYDFEADREIRQLGLIASGSQFYVTESGEISVNFDRLGDHYQGAVKIKAYDLWTGEYIYVDGVFDLRGITPVHTCKHQ